MKQLIILSLLALLPLRLWAQTETVDNGQPADSIDRLAPDFVTASVCIADPTDWRNDFMGVTGHAFLRLQCPTFDMDYCFSYESESAKDEMSRFLKGQLTMGMFRVKTEEYIQPFQRWNCAIRQYTLNLPPEAKLRLWEIMDKKVDEGEELRFDLVRRGCTQTIVQFIERALNGTSIDYAAWPEEYTRSRRQIINERLMPYPWISFLLSELLLDTDIDENISPERKIVFPSQLEEAWMGATVAGRPLMEYHSNLVTADALQVEETIFTPLMLSCLLFFLSALLVFTRQTYSDLAFIVLQSMVGIVLCWLVMMSNLPGSRGIHLLLLYNPLPLLLLRWRKYWSIPYAVLLIVWAFVTTLILNIYIDPAHLVFAAAIVIVMLKTSPLQLPQRKAPSNSPKGEEPVRG